MMSDEIWKGLGDAVGEVVLGIILSTLFVVIKSLESIPSCYIGLIQLFEIVIFVGSIVLILAMETWAIGYLAGWLFGTWIMWFSGLVEDWIFVLYLVVGGLYLVVKFLKKVRACI